MRIVYTGALYKHWPDDLSYLEADGAKDDRGNLTTSKNYPNRICFRSELDVAQKASGTRKQPIL
jgi:hypothetical protein